MVTYTSNTSGNKRSDSFRRSYKRLAQEYQCQFVICTQSGVVKEKTLGYCMVDIFPNDDDTSQMFGKMSKCEDV